MVRDTFSGKWAISWHDHIWGPFNTKEQAERLKAHLEKNRNAPQTISIFPMWAPNYFYDLVRDYDGKHSS